MAERPEEDRARVPFDRRPRGAAFMPGKPEWYADPRETGYPPKLGQRCVACRKMNGGYYMRGGRLQKVGVKRDCPRCGLSVWVGFGALPRDAREFVQRVDGRECAPGGYDSALIGRRA